MRAEVYSRVAASPGLGTEELERLQQATVAVIGLGVLGGQLSYHLALLGVRQVLIDPGEVEPPNLGNQGFPASSLGQPKAEIRRHQALRLNPHCQAEAVCARIEDLGLAALAGADLLLTGLDSRASRCRTNTIARRLGIPWIDSGVDGTGRWLRGTVTVYDPRSASPCYLCRYDRGDLAAIGHEGRPRGCPSWHDPAVSVSAPTLQASSLAAVVAGFQALWAVRMLLCRGQDLPGRQLVIAADTLPQVRITELPRNPRCLGDHRPPFVLQRCDQATVAGFLRQAAVDLGTEVEEVRLHERTLVDGLVCTRCKATRSIVRVPAATTVADRRCSCEPHAGLAPRHLVNYLPGAAARQLGDARWDELGLPAAEVVTAAAGGREVHYVVNAPDPHGKSHGQESPPRQGAS